MGGKKQQARVISQIIKALALPQSNLPNKVQQYMLLRVQYIISFFEQDGENAETAERMDMNWGVSLKCWVMDLKAFRARTCNYMR